MEKFDFKNKRNIYALVVVLVILGLGYWFYSDMWTQFDEDRKALDEKILKLSDELREINIQKQRKVELEQDLVNANKEFERLKEMFPEQEKVPLRLQDLYGVVRSSGVQISRFSPEQTVPREHYIENKYGISINSGYHMLGYLFAEIANFKYPTSISGLKISRYGNIAAELEKATMHGWTPVTLKVDFNLTTYTSKKIK